MVNIALPAYDQVRTPSAIYLPLRRFAESLLGVGFDRTTPKIFRRLASRGKCNNYFCKDRRPSGYEGDDRNET
jgi:hypothetical protein